MHSVIVNSKSPFVIFEISYSKKPKEKVDIKIAFIFVLSNTASEFALCKAHNKVNKEINRYLLLFEALEIFVVWQKINQIRVVFIKWIVSWYKWYKKEKMIQKMKEKHNVIK